MEQKLYQQQIIDLSISSKLPRNYFSKLNVFIQTLGKDYIALQHFLQQLNEYNHCIINEYDFKKTIRIIQRIIIKINNKQCQQLFLKFFISSSQKYYPYYIRSNMINKFKKLIQLGKTMKMLKPNNYLNQKQIMFFIFRKYSQQQQQWLSGLIHVINQQTLADKKNQEITSLKMNNLFNNFIVKHFKQIFPQLNRLLVKSESNIYVWDQFLSSLNTLPLIDQYCLICLKTIQHLFQKYPINCIRIVNILTNSLNYQTIISIIQFMGNLLCSQHNVKKKIVLIKMLQGLIQSSKKLVLINQQECLNILLRLLINNWLKFIEQDQYYIITTMLYSILQNLQLPQQKTLELCKTQLKNQNKYVLVYLGLTLVFIIQKIQVMKLQPIHKEIIMHYKEQYKLIAYKIQMNWQWALPIIRMLSFYNTEYLDIINVNLAIFKQPCLSLSKLQQINACLLICEKINKLCQTNEQITQQYYIILCLMLQKIRNKKQWQKIINKLNDQNKLKIISYGIYPQIYYLSNNININKNNQFQSLISFILKNISNIISFQYFKFQYVIICAHLKHVNFHKNIQISKEYIPYIQNCTIKFIKLYMFNYKNQKESFIDQKMHYLIFQSLIGLLNHCSGSNLLLFVQNFINQNNYHKNLQELCIFEQKVKQEVQQFHKELHKYEQILVERYLYQPQKKPIIKIYNDVNEDKIKIMNEIQVKQQKYAQHFKKMLFYFNKFIQLFIRKIQIDYLFTCKLWQNYYTSLIRMSVFPQHRAQLYRLIRKSCQCTAFYNRKSIESKIIQKYSCFFGDFFCIRFSNLTPSVQLMQKCQRFLQQLLQLSFETVDKSYAMLQSVQNQFIIIFINDMCQYLLQNMQFDIGLKKLALKFYCKCLIKDIKCSNFSILYTYMVNNINILSTCNDLKIVLEIIIKNIQPIRYKQLFQDILSFIPQTKKIILQVMVNIEQRYKPQFQEYIKLRILEQQNCENISQLAKKILKNQKSHTDSIKHFQMKKFIKKNSKQTVQKLLIFINQEMTVQLTQSIYHLVINTAQQLFNQHFDQQGLQMFPYFLNLNIDNIPEMFLNKIFQLLVVNFTANNDYVTLSKMSFDVGILIIKKYAHIHAEKILNILQSSLNKVSSISNIIFLGVLAPHLHNHDLSIVQKRITQLFMTNNPNEQKAIAKCIPDLMQFFKNPIKIVDNIFNHIAELNESQQIGQAFLASGLLKGIGNKEIIEYFQKIIDKQYIAKTTVEKLGRIAFLNAFIDNFGKFIENQSIRIIEILINYMWDKFDAVAKEAKKIARALIVKISAYAVRNLLPYLLNGLQNQRNWRVKICFIEILGVMANISARQLQTSLPVIVPTLSICMSNAHPVIRQKASEALNLIGQTIKNPQISQTINILIEALQNPFDDSDKALQLLKKTPFAHYIDPPSLSTIIPIIDYCLRSRNLELRADACQVIGSIVHLIQNQTDLLPYIKILTIGLKNALCDPLSQVRCIASMAIGRISAKIGIKNAQIYFHFVLEIIQNAASNTTERHGAAQAYSEIISSHNFEYFQDSLNNIFQKLNQAKRYQRQGYILIFLYVPVIRRDQFQIFIRQVNENMYKFVSDEDENVRNSAMQVQKILINNYGISHTNLLLDPLCDGVFSSNWRKRNAALLLIGELLNIVKSYMYNSKNSDKNQAYYRALMAVYILKDDELDMPRATATQVWNTYIENTPKTIKLGLNDLVRMWTKWTHSADGIIFKNIISFCSKYGENYFYEILKHLEKYLENTEHKQGVFQILTEFIKRLTQQFLSRQQYRNYIKKFYTENVFQIQGYVRQVLTKSLALYVEKMHQQQFFDNLIYPQIDLMNDLTENDHKYTKLLHLIKDLLSTSSNRITDRLISKICEFPLSQFKIEVITNNSNKLANYLYTAFKIPITEMFITEIYHLIGNTEKENRLSLIIYCLNQVSSKLNNVYKAKFIQNISNHISKLIPKIKEKYNEKLTQVFLGMIWFFLRSNPLQEVENLQNLIGQIVPLLFIQYENIKQTVHNIILILVSNPKQQKTALYYRQTIVSMQNNLGENNIIWNNKDIMSKYIDMIVKSIAYGSNQTMQQSIEMMQFMMKCSTMELLKHNISRMVGPVIRVLNYPLLQRQKINLMQFLTRIQKQHYNIEMYNNQILSVCFRLLQQYRNTEQCIKLVAQFLSVLLIQNSNKNQLVNLILLKSKLYGLAFVKAIYYLLKKIINDDTITKLPKNILQKIYENFNTVMMHNQKKLPIKGIYYASKNTARVGNYLKISSSLLQKQLTLNTCSYQVLLNYLHFCYYQQCTVPYVNIVETFIKQSPKDHVYYLLKALKQCRNINDKTKKNFTHQYLSSIVPQTIAGFQDIIQILEDLEE